MKKSMNNVAAILTLTAFSAAGGILFAAEFEVLDRFSVDGYTVLKGSADIPGGSLTVGGSAFVVKSGSVGIGTANPGAKLEVSGGNILLGNNSGGAASVYKYVPQHTAGYDGSLSFALMGGSININHVYGGYGHSDYANEYITFNTHHGAETAGERVRIDPAGNIGIGTANPAAKLEIQLLSANSKVKIDTLTNYSSRIADFASPTGAIWFTRETGANYTGEIGAYDPGSGYANMAYVTYSDHVFVNSDREVMRLKQNGNVGVGTTGPEYQLDVIGIMQTRRSLAADVGGQLQIGHGTALWKLIGNQWNGGDFMIRDPAAVDVIYFPQAGGNIGIGTSSPVTQSKLTVAGSLSVNGSDGDFSSGGNRAMIDIAGGYARIGSVNGGGSAMGTKIMAGAGVEAITISSSGNVGVGTTNPAANFDVGGTGSIKIPVGTTGERPGSPANGMMRLNTTTGKLEYYYNSGWNSVGALIATGGTVTEAGGYRIHTFTTVGDSAITFTTGGTVEYLVVAGGGQGGTGQYNGGGGGAGGFRTAAGFTVTAQSYTVTVGAGGSGNTEGSKGASGGNSVFGPITSIGGGGGGSHNNPTGASGGSGGGGSQGSASGGSGTSGQGYAGGGLCYALGAGGGGASAVGASSSPPNGGAGAASSIFGTSIYYAGGGGGGGRQVYSIAQGIGGNGGGGNGGLATGGNGYPGTANTGGGGGGVGSDADNATTRMGGAGGSGIVIIRYPI